MNYIVLCSSKCTFSISYIRKLSRSPGSTQSTMKAAQALGWMALVLLSTTVNGIPSSKGLSSLIENVNLVSNVIIKDLNCAVETDSTEFQEKLADFTKKTAKKVREEVQTNGDSVITAENREKMRFGIIAKASEELVNSYDNCTLNGESSFSINEVKSILMKQIFVSHNHPQMMELMELMPVVFRELLDQLECKTGNLSTQEFNTLYFASAFTAQLDLLVWDSHDLNAIAEEISKLTKQLLLVWLMTHCIPFFMA